MKLSATRVRALRDPGRYSDGDGLHLFIHKNGRRSWVQRITVDGQRRDGRGADPDGPRESTPSHQPVDRGAAQSCKFLYFSAT